MYLPLSAGDADDVDRAARYAHEGGDVVDDDAEEAEELRDGAAVRGQQALAALHGAGAAGLRWSCGRGRRGRRAPGAGRGGRKEREEEDGSEYHRGFVHEVHPFLSFFCDERLLL